MHSRQRDAALALAGLACLVVGCRGAGPEADPAPTAGSHEPEVANRYGTAAQETRDHQEAKAADSPNDDPDTKEDEGRRLPTR